MKLELCRYYLRIIPENEVEEVYLESALNLKKDGDYTKLVRVDVTKDSGVINYLKTENLLHHVREE